MSVDPTLTLSEQYILDEVRAAKDRHELALALRRHDALSQSSNIRERGHSISCQGFDRDSSRPYCQIQAAGIARMQTFDAEETARIANMSALELASYMIEGPGWGVIEQGTYPQAGAVYARLAALRAATSATVELTNDMVEALQALADGHGWSPHESPEECERAAVATMWIRSLTLRNADQK